MKKDVQSGSNAKKGKMRLYGFDYQKEGFLDPKILVEDFFRSGLGVDSAFIASHTFEAQWICNVAESYLLLTFPSKAKRKAVEDKWRKISHQSHGQPIAHTIICED